MNIQTESDLPILEPSGIGEFVKHSGCLMHAKLNYEGEEVRKSRNWKEAFQPLSPLPSEVGDRFEKEIYNKFELDEFTVIDSWKDYKNQEENNKKIINNLKKVESDAVIFEQARLMDTIGKFKVAGDADLIIAWPEENKVRIRVFDIKSSWEEKPYQQIQTATYSILLKKLLDVTDISYTIETGVITRESNVSTMQPSDLPQFDTETRETDIYKLLDENGVLQDTFEKEIDDVEHHFGTHCHNCPYNEACLTRAIEKTDIRLLKLSRGEQEALREHDIHTLSDLADLVEPVQDAKPYEYEYPDIKPEYNELVSEISEEHSVGERLPLLAQKAQSLLGELNPDDENAHDKPWAQWIIGSGQGTLPEDDPHPATNIEPCTEERGDLIRVYLNVQWDYLRDRMSAIAGRVDCTNYRGTPPTVSEGINKIPNSDEEQEKQERELIDSFFTKLFGAIKTVGELTTQNEEAAVHLYFYTSHERDALMESVKRHNNLDTARSVRDLLGLRGGIDQSMVSVLQDEVEDRLALKTVSTGLLPILEQTFPDKSHRMKREDWKYTRDDGTKIQLRDAFYHRLFDYSVPYEQSKDGMELLLEEGYGDGFYPSRARFDAQIPLEYIWATKEVNELTTEWTDDERYKGIIKQYLWVNNNDQKHRIRMEDICRLAEKFCEAAEHIERGMKYKNPDIEKKKIELDSLEAFNIGETSLASSCLEYLDLEYATTKQETLKHYQKPIKQRVLTGKSVPVEIQSAYEEDGLLFAEGRLIYEDFDFASPQQVANSCRQSGSDGSSSGSWMVATPIENNNGVFRTTVNRPEYIMNSSPVSIESIDTDSMKIQLRGFPNAGSKEDKYRTWHKHYTTDPDSDSQGTLFENGRRFILDPSCDDLTSQRSSVALKNVSSNTIYNSLEKYINGKNTTKVERFDKEKIDEFTDWLVENYNPSPNKKQQQFIQSTSGEVNLLQGPPGTGKTSGAIALAILARVYAAESQTRGLITGASNKAVDETMEDVASALQAYTETNKDSSELDDVFLVRLVGDEPPEHEKINGVKYVNYHEETDELLELYERIYTTGNEAQTRLGEHSDESPPHVILFATPSRTFGLVKNLARKDGSSVEDIYGDGTNLFDLYAADEASMLPLPQLLLGGAFLDDSKGWQALIAGDQRQMPPVQTHDWKKEDRRTIEEVAPFLSVLNYFRFLRGDDVDVLDEFENLDSPNVDIPITRLKETYRCHKTVAEFLRRWVYSKDDIQYSSSQTYTIGTPRKTEGGVGETLNPDAPITLVLHDDERSQQSNPVEASIAGEIVENAPKTTSIGIVTPHNSQKGLLKSVCGNRSQVDTVERFQGGERDMIIVSATVSDPDYLSNESDFILNPNRLNVALSRMKKKLIVLAPKSLFRMIPDDIEVYDNATIWKGLYSEVSPNKGSEWSGDLSDYTDVRINDVDSSVSVYSKR